MTGLYKPDDIAKAFRDACPANWTARPYLNNRANGIFNAVKFSYKGGLMAFLMDCDKPVGESFTLIFSNMSNAPFKSYANAIQKGLYRILTALEAQGFTTGYTPLESYRQIEWAVNAESGTVTRLRIVTPPVPGTAGEGSPSATDQPDDKSSDFDVDELL